MATGKIKDPNPPRLSGMGFAFGGKSYVNILKIGVLVCDECKDECNEYVEHIYFDNLDENFTKPVDVEFDHADFANKTNIQTRLAVNVKIKTSTQSN